MLAAIFSVAHLAAVPQLLTRLEPVACPDFREPRPSVVFRCVCECSPRFAIRPLVRMSGLQAAVRR